MVIKKGGIMQTGYVSPENIDREAREEIICLKIRVMELEKSMKELTEKIEVWNQLAGIPD
jgi:hypothetical protein